MNFSFDWGAVVVAAIGAFVSVAVVKNDMRWLRESITRLEKEVAVAHKRIDALLGRTHDSRHSDYEREHA